MKIIIQAIATALLIGSASVATASNAPARHHHRAADYNAVSPRTDQSLREFGSFTDDTGDDSRGSATGGPAGGLTDGN